MLCSARKTKKRKISTILSRNVPLGADLQKLGEDTHTNFSSGVDER